jgi:hypothetical protein
MVSTEDSAFFLRGHHLHCFCRPKHKSNGKINNHGFGFFSYDNFSYRNKQKIEKDIFCLN